MTAATGTADAGRLLDPSLYASGDPFALYAELRRTAPVCWVDHERGGFWAVTTHPEVSHIGADPGGFCSSRGILTDEIGTTYETPPTMMHTDPPQHTRYRRLVQPGFKPSMVRLMEAGVTAKATGALGSDPGRRRVRRRAGPLHPVPPPGDLRAARGGRVAVATVLRLVRGRHPRRGRADRGAADGAPDRNVGVPDRRGRGTAEGAGGRPRVGPGQRRIRCGERRRGADRGRAGHVLDPAAGGGERDHPQPDLGWARGAGRESRAMGRPAGGSVPHSRRRRRAAALDHARDLLHAHGDGRHHHPWRRSGRRRPGPVGLRLGQPGRGGLRARRGQAAHRPPSQSHT